MASPTEDPMLTQAWALSGSVALRPEPFGALAYHFGNRKLTFLKNQQLVDVVRSLGDFDTVAQALDGSQVPGTQRSAYIKALHGLAASDMIHQRRTT